MSSCKMKINLVSPKLKDNGITFNKLNSPIIKHETESSTRPSFKELRKSSFNLNKNNYENYTNDYTELHAK